MEKQRVEETRNWPGLPADLVWLVAERLLADDPAAGSAADYIRFRAVCRSWRSCTAEQRDLPGHFRPREHWIMLPDEYAVGPGDRCRFLDLSTGEFFWLVLPELRGRVLGCLYTVGGGLLLFEDAATTVVRILNPFTHTVTQLPPLESEPRPVSGPLYLDPYHNDHFRSANAALSHSSVDGRPLVMLYFPVVTRLQFAKAGDRRWTVFKNLFFLSNVLSFQGRFYGAEQYGSVLMFPACEAESEPQAIAIVSRERPANISLSRSFLVESAGEMLMVQRYSTRPPAAPDETIQVFKVDLGRRMLVPMRSIEGRATFFLGNRAVLSVAASSSSSSTNGRGRSHGDILTSIRPNSVYSRPMFTYPRRAGVVYDLQRGEFVVDAFTFCAAPNIGEERSLARQILDCYCARAYRNQWDD